MGFNFEGHYYCLLKQKIMLTFSMQSHQADCYQTDHVVEILVPMALHGQLNHIFSHFNCFDLRNQTQWCHWWCCWHHMLPIPVAMASYDINSHFIPSFQLSWLKECSGAIDNAIGVIWCKCFCQWCYMTKRVMVYLILIILTYRMEWSHWQCH